VPARNYPRKRSTQEILSLFTNVATTNHFEFAIRAFPSEMLKYIQQREPLLTMNFLSRELGLLCKGAELPGATFATAQVKGNYMGVAQKYAHTRIFTESSFTFIVDSQYRVLKFFQLWQEYISSASEASPDKKAYYYRMRYPDAYKCSQMLLSKFDRDHFQKIDYTYINAFPINITPTAVDYGNNKVLEISVTFNYDRFLMGSISSLDTHSEQSKTLMPGDINELGQKVYSSDPIPFALPGDGEYPSYADSNYSDFKSNYFTTSDNTGLTFDWGSQVDMGY
jgi:hypothetical protein